MSRFVAFLLPRDEFGIGGIRHAKSAGLELSVAATFV
jgi:hypothetical protein